MLPGGGGKLRHQSPSAGHKDNEPRGDEKHAEAIGQHVAFNHAAANMNALTHPTPSGAVA